MARSAFLNVMGFVALTWALYLAIFFFIEAVTGPVRAFFPESAQEILLVMAGVLMLAPFIVVWNLLVLRRYYPKRVRELIRGGASPPPERSA